MYSEMKKPLKEDVKKILDDPINEKYRDHITDEKIEVLCQDPYSAVFIVGGEPVVVGGLIFYWGGRGKIWSLFASIEKHKFVTVFRLMKKYIDSLDVKRIELDVPYNNDNFKRRAKMLGFEKYADRARCFNAFGEDCTLFERIK